MSSKEAPVRSGEQLAEIEARIQKGGAAKYHEKNAAQGKLFARERIRLLVDEGSFVEDGLYANCLDPELPADGVVTGLSRIGGRAGGNMVDGSHVVTGRT